MSKQNSTPKTIKGLHLDLAEDWLDKHPLLRDVINILKTHQLEAYLVGGAVRDLLLEREHIVDLDFAVPGDGLAVARRVANALNAAFYALDQERGTGRVVFETASASGPSQTYLDFATFRGPTLLADLTDRDFTINAMTLSLTEPFELIDPLQGQRDLALGRIRVASPTAFSHDPVRVLRAVRQAVELEFAFEAKTEQYLRVAAPGLISVSPERQRDELLKLLNTPAPGQAIQKLYHLGVISHFLPEIEPMIGVSQGPPHYLDVFDHTTAALEAWAGMLRTGFSDVPAYLQAEVGQELDKPLAGHLTQRLLLPLAMLLHDAGKPSTRSQEGTGPEAKIRFIGHEKVSVKIARRMMQRFHFSNQATDFIEMVVAHHLRPLLLAVEGQVSRRAIYRFFRDTAGGTYQAGVAVALHALADCRAIYPPQQGQAEMQQLREVTRQLVAGYFEQHDQIVEPPPLLTGHDLIEAFGLAEGRLIGVLLNRLKEAQATGEVADKAAALTFIQADPDFIRYQQNDR